MEPPGRRSPPPEAAESSESEADPQDFDDQKRSGIVWQNHEGELIEDMWFRPGRAERQSMESEIAPVLGHAGQEAPQT